MWNSQRQFQINQHPIENGNQETHISLKRKVWSTFILPVLTYGKETMIITQKSATKLKSTQRAMERCLASKSTSESMKLDVSQRHQKEALADHKKDVLMK